MPNDRVERRAAEPEAVGRHSVRSKRIVSHHRFHRLVVNDFSKVRDTGSDCDNQRHDKDDKPVERPPEASSGLRTKMDALTAAAINNAQPAK
jgi:hypothetical protein